MDTPDITTTKRCSKCGELKPHDQFYINNITGRVAAACKPCYLARRRELYAPTAKRPKYDTPPDGMKYCRRCGLAKPHDAFCRESRASDGLSSHCKSCRADESREYRGNNQEKERQRQHKWNKANSDRSREIKRDYARRKRADDPAGENEKRAKYRRAHPERIREAHRRWIAKHPENNRLHAHRRRTAKLNLPNSFTPTDWLAVIDHFNGCCAVCGRPAGLWHTLALDHWIPITSPDCPGTVVWNIVPLCHGINGCNNSKHKKDAAQWLVEKFGKRKGRVILKRIETYLEARRWGTA